MCCRTLLALGVALGLSLATSRADDKQPDKGPGVLSELLPRVALGLAVEELPNTGPHGGLVVRQITADGPAAKAGLKTGDIIVRVSGMSVDDYEELLGAIAGQKAGDQLTFVAVRDGEPMRMKVTLGEPGKDAGAPPEGCKRCAYLGVLTVPTTSLSDAMADRFGLSDDKGLVVVDVVPGSPASAVGLRHGDVIRSIDGTEIDDPDALRSHVKQAGTGKAVALSVRRGDRSREVKATLAEGPCDILLFTPKNERGGNSKTDQLQQRVEELEKRIKELEGKRTSKPEK